MRELPPLDNRLAHLDAAADITHVLGFTLWPRAVTMKLRAFKTHLKAIPWKI